MVGSLETLDLTWIWATAEGLWISHKIGLSTSLPTWLEFDVSLDSTWILRYFNSTSKTDTLNNHPEKETQYRILRLDLSPVSACCGLELRLRSKIKTGQIKACPEKNEIK